MGNAQSVESIVVSLLDAVDLKAYAVVKEGNIVSHKVSQQEYKQLLPTIVNHAARLLEESSRLRLTSDPVVMVTHYKGLGLLVSRVNGATMTVVASDGLASQLASIVKRLAEGRVAKCPRCGTVLDSYSTICPSCGRAVPFMAERCPFCGADISHKKCPRCRAELVTSTQGARLAGGEEGEEEAETPARGHASRALDAVLAGSLFAAGLASSIYAGPVIGALPYAILAALYVARPRRGKGSG